jgi:hypothetical protein
MRRKETSTNTFRTAGDRFLSNRQRPFNIYLFIYVEDSEMLTDAFPVKLAGTVAEDLSELNTIVTMAMRQERASRPHNWLSLEQTHRIIMLRHHSKSCTAWKKNYGI